MKAEDLVARLEGRGVQLVPRGEAVAVRPAGVLTPDEREAIRRLRPEVVRLLRVRAMGLDWSRVRLADLDRVLEVAVPWSDTRLLIAPGCRIAKELRAADSHPGRVWCTHELADLVLLGVGREDAKKSARPVSSWARPR